MLRQVLKPFKVAGAGLVITYKYGVSIMAAHVLEMDGARVSAAMYWVCKDENVTTQSAC